MMSNEIFYVEFVGSYNTWLMQGQGEMEVSLIDVNK